MASDKRVILSSKRARSRRKKAARNTSTTQETPAPECATLLLLPTATHFSNANKEDAANGTTVTVHVYDEQQKHEPRRCDRASQETTSDEDDELEEDEEDGVVIVCRPTMPDFCTRFVPEVHHPMTPAHTSASAPDLRSFTASIPSFRETRDGFITYTIALTLCHDPCKQFVVERRFSDFVALATTLNQSSGWLSSSSDAALQFQGSLPSKTWFRVTQVTTLEERRGKLQTCLQELLAQDDGTTMPQLPALRDFLMLDIFGAQIVEEKLLQQD